MIRKPFSEYWINARPSLNPMAGFLVLASIVNVACTPDNNNGKSMHLPPEPAAEAGSAVDNLQFFTVANPSQRPALKLQGEVTSAPVLDLSFPVSGRLTELGLREGRIVTPDLPAARLAPGPFREAIENALQQRTRALSGFTQAEADLRRQQLLFEAGSASQSSVTTAEEYLAARRFNLEMAEQQLANARQAETSSSMVGGVNGVVLAVHVDVNDTIEAGQPIYTVETDAPAKVKFQLPRSADWVFSEPAEIKAASADNPQQMMAVNQIEAVGNGDSLFLASIATPTDTFRTGQTVEVTIRSKAPPSQFVIPFDALFQDANGVYVLILKDRQIVRRSVKPSAVAENGVSIEHGLNGGETLVLGTIPRDQLKHYSAPIPNEQQ